MNFDVFKHELMNLRAYERSIRQLEKQKADIIYKYAGVHGINFEKIPSTAGDRQKALLEMSEKIEEIERQIDRTQIKVDDINRNLAKLPQDIQDAVVLLYCDRMSLRYVGAIFDYSYNGIYQKIKREVERI